MTSGDWGRRKDDPDAHWNKPRRSPAKKDRRRWCRGKVGVEHVTEVVADGWYGRVCRESKIGKWVHYETFRRFEITGTRWSCVHVEQCVNCGKKMRHLGPEECPLNAEHLLGLLA